MTSLKLIALDEDDLQILSAHVQDAVAREADLAYLPAEGRFVALINRFDWTDAVGEMNGRRRSYVRRRAALRIDKVKKAQIHAVTPGNGSQVLSLLAVQFQPANIPSGFITLVFSGGAAIRLTVECVEAELRDLDAAWVTRSLPRHPDDGEGANSNS